MVVVSIAELCLPLDFCRPADASIWGSSLEGDCWSASTSVLLDDRPLCGKPIRGDFEGFMGGESLAPADTLMLP
jgi:hypothetical protein